MAEDLQSGICGENNWWSIDSTRSLFPPPLTSSSSSSPNCSVAASNDAGNCSTWKTDGFMDLKATSRSCGGGGETNNNLVVSDHSYQLGGGFQHEQKPHKNNESSDGGGGSILIDSTLQMMGYGLSSSTSSANWNHHSLFSGCNNGRPENNFNNSMVQEETDIDSSSNPQIQHDWITSKSFSSSSSSAGCSGSQVSSIDIFKPMNQEFSTMSSINSTIGLSSGGLPIGLGSYVSPSTLIQNLYEPDPQLQPQLQHSLFTNYRSSMSYSSTENYGASSSSSNIELSPIWSKVSSSSPFLKPSSSSSMEKQQQQQPPIGLHFSNNTTFWNASADALNDMRAGSFASSPSPHRPSILLNKGSNWCIETNCKSEEYDMDSTKKHVSEAAFKRPRIESPSPLPTFKVRKEKLGDRVTALQQLVSPFGKTDTASVLHEAIEYIKFLHDQVTVLSTPYMKSGTPIQHHQGCDDTKDQSSSERAKQDLRSRGLCLVPISSTFPVATETTADFWTPSLSFGGGSSSSLLR